MAEYDFSLDWSSERRHYKPSSHHLKVLIDGKARMHVVRCITGPDGVCVAAVLNENGNLQPDDSDERTGQVKTEVIFGDVRVVESIPEDRRPKKAEQESISEETAPILHDPAAD